MPGPTCSRSPSERIGLLMSPAAAHVRTPARNLKMTDHVLPQTYLHSNVPPAREPDVPPEAYGVLGLDPAASHFLPLEEFDNDELDPHTPQVQSTCLPSSPFSPTFPCQVA